MQTNRSTVLNEIRVTYKSGAPITKAKLSNPDHVVEVLRACWEPDTIEYKEYFVMLLLNRAHHLIGFHRVSEGGLTGTLVDVKIIFSVALKCNCAAIILCHNHPSGNTIPSSSDIALTTRIREGGKLLDIAVLDHIIITSDSYYSFADEGMLC